MLEDFFSPRDRRKLAHQKRKATVKDASGCPEIYQRGRREESRTGKEEVCRRQIFLCMGKVVSPKERTHESRKGLSQYRMDRVEEPAQPRYLK